MFRYLIDYIHAQRRLHNEIWYHFVMRLYICLGIQIRRFGSLEDVTYTMIQNTQGYSKSFFCFNQAVNDFLYFSNAHLIIT